ncbi:MAG: glycosyltransferase family 39 protein [Anaerolineae bacterium]|nr:MAG: glycosyltransferase family 39 protein [Anaerolineae bacterium]
MRLVQRTRETWDEFTYDMHMARWDWLWPTLVIVILTLLAVQPLMRPSVICSHEGLLHLLRLIELDQSLQHGQLYPRWSPDMAYGYGYPLFNFISPLPLYPAEALHLLGLSFVAAWNATLALCLLASGLSAYLLARDWMPEHGALIAAVAYLLAPYSLYSILFQGNLTESVALPLLPLSLWALGRLVRSNQARYLALAALSLGSLLLTHQAIALLFSPMLALYALALWWRERRIPWPLLTVFTASILALGLSAFFWLPALLEKDAVQVVQAFATGKTILGQDFVSPAELFSLPVPVPASPVEPSSPRSLSLAALVLGLLGLLPLIAQLGYRLWRRFKAAFPIFAYDISAEVRRAWHLFALETEPGTRPATHLPISQLPNFPIPQPPLIPPTSPRERGQLLLLVGALCLSLMMLPPSLPLWERAPLLQFVQFPWRFLGPTSLIVAFLAGNSLSLVPLVDRQRWLVVGTTAAAMTLLAAASLGWLYPRDCGQPDTSIASIPRFERRIGIIGTTPTGEYLPRYIQEMPNLNALTDMYETGIPIERLDAASLPQGAMIELAEYKLTSARLLIHSPEPFRATYRAFYFPGWRVAINGKNAPIVITAPHGLISFDVPAGQAAVQVWFGTTPLRLGSTLLSSVTLLTVLWLAWQGRREGSFAPASRLAAARWWQWLILAILAGGLLWAKIALVNVK